MSGPAAETRDPPGGELRHAYAPPWAPHAGGRHSDRDEDGAARWEARCAGCAAEHRGVCQRGLPRDRIAAFAAAHRQCAARG